MDVIDPLMENDLSSLPALIDAEQSAGSRLFTRVRVVNEAGSTQDVAREQRQAGLIVAANRQTAGRGRLGRTWSDGAGHGVAMTLTLDAETFDTARLSIASAIGVLRGIRLLLPRASGVEIGVRWPNDVVERSGLRRKIAGVLIERVSNLAYVGVGINVGQREEDWPRELTGRAVSVRELGGSATRTEAAHRVILEIEKAMQESMDSLLADWRESDVLIGSVRTFTHDGRRHSGKVLTIDPASSLVVQTSSGERLRLPAMTTSLDPE